MKRKNTWLVLFLLFFGALCFGAGVFYGQHVWVEKGFIYTENAAEPEVFEESSGFQVNINTAGSSALSDLDGVGSVTAEKIVKSREEEGFFTEPYDLVTRGILGETKYRVLEPYLTVE